MTISASIAVTPSDLLDRCRELYRDLSVGLQGRIAQLTIGSGSDTDLKGYVEAVKAHHKALQTVLDLEASFEKRGKQWNGGASSELDLHNARDEILARIALWAAGK